MPRNDEPYDASDPEKVSARKAEVGRRAKSDEQLLSAIMDLAEGRAFIWKLLQECHIWSSTFDYDNPHGTSFREGERNIGLRLFARVSAVAAEQYQLMVKENS